MKKGIFKKLSHALLAGVLSMSCCLFAGGCNSNSDPNLVRFMAYGDQTTQDMYKAVAEAYNATQGKVDGITVETSVKSESDYTSMLQITLTGKTAPDVFITTDAHFKSRTAMNLTANMTEMVDAAVTAGELDLDSIYGDTVTRFRYDKALNMSGDDKDTYGLPFDTYPSALYYNRTALEDRGVTVISVAAEDMDRWNNGEIDDTNGVSKASLTALDGITVPAKGFFRNDANTRKSSSRNWVEPTVGTVMVFNDRIPMNWDEIEDLGFLMTAAKNKSKKPSTTYGYFTQWWFNYGWAVGGDCLVDVSGNGSWLYSHGDWTGNYIVNEGKTYTGAITGKTYASGETLEFLDKLNVNKGDTVTSDGSGGYLVNGQPLGAMLVALTNDSATRQDVKDRVADKTLTALPSTREAFSRFVYLVGGDPNNTPESQKKALEICPNPNMFSSGDAIRYFTSGNVALLAETSDCVPTSQRLIGDRFEWGVAPLPVYKVYAAPSSALTDLYGDRADAYNTAVAKQGKLAGHSECTALVINDYSDKKDKAFKFITWMVGEKGQAEKAKYGYIPNQKSVQSTFYEKYDPTGKRKLNTLVGALEYETPGDWWYLADEEWIKTWSIPLNTKVRNNEMTLDNYFTTYIGSGNTAVRPYGNWDGDMSKVK